MLKTTKKYPGTSKPCQLPNRLLQSAVYIYIHMWLNMIMKSFNQFDFGHKHAPLIMDWNESKTIVESKQLELKGDFIA